MTSSAPTPAASSLGDAVTDFFTNKRNVALYIIVPLCSVVYASACIAYGISRCRKKRARASIARKKSARAAADHERREFLDSTGSTSSLKSLIGVLKDRNRVAPNKSEDARRWQAPGPPGSAATPVSFSNKSYQAGSGGPENGGAPPTARKNTMSRFADPTLLLRIAEENESSYSRTQEKRNKDVNWPASRLATRANGSTVRTMTAEKPLAIREEVDAALQNLRAHSCVDVPISDDLRRAMKAVIGLETEVQCDPKAREQIARYRDNKQQLRQNNLHEVLKKGDWQKLPISEWIAIKRAAADYETSESAAT